MLHLALHIFLWSLVAVDVLAQTSLTAEYPVSAPEDSISILYNGTISGTYRAPNSTKNCTIYPLGPYRRSYFTFGVNPPWDPNPFFFQLDHEASEYTGGFWTQTSNSIWLLWALSADRVLNVSLPGGWAPGDRCSSCSPSNKTVARVWNLEAAQTKMDKSASGEVFYNITGSPSTFLDKGVLKRMNVYITPITSLRDFETQQAIGCISTDPLARYSDTTMIFNWASSANPTYSIAISNSTANIFMTLTTASGFLTLFFTGTRLDYPYQGDSGNFDNVTIQLDTSNPAMPSFTYTNGSKFSWVPKYGANYSDGPWQPLAEGVSRGKNTTKASNAPVVGALGSSVWSWWILGLVGMATFI